VAKIASKSGSSSRQQLLLVHTVSNQNPEMCKCIQRASLQCMYVGLYVFKISPASNKAMIFHQSCFQFVFVKPIYRQRCQNATRCLKIMLLWLRSSNTFIIIERIF